MGNNNYGPRAHNLRTFLVEICFFHHLRGDESLRVIIFSSFLITITNPVLYRRETETELERARRDRRDERDRVDAATVTAEEARVREERVREERVRG